VGPEGQTGITFDGVILSHLEFRRPPQPPGEQPLNIKLNAVRRLHDEGKRLQLELQFDLFPDEKTAHGFVFKGMLVGEFSKTGDGGMSLEEFSRVAAPAHMVPFLRELV